MQVKADVKYRSKSFAFIRQILMFLKNQYGRSLWQVPALLLFLLTVISARAQELPEGKFLEDSLSPGKILHYSLVFTHPEAEVVVFSDSLPAGSSFILEEKKWFPTYTAEGISRDSAVYKVRSFEVDDTLILSIPVYLFSENDSSAIYPLPASIYYRRLIPSDSLENIVLKANTDLLPLKPQFNYLLLLTVSGGVIVLITLTGMFFGKSIRKFYNRFKLMRMHKAFLQDFSGAAKEYKKKRSSDSLEHALSLWKKYLSRLDQNGLESYTTTEITENYKNDELKKALRDLDKAIYGGIINDETGKSLKFLKNFSNKRLIIRKNEVTNG